MIPWKRNPDDPPFSKREPHEEQEKYFDAPGIVDEAAVNARVSMNGHRVELDCIVHEYGDNWRISSIGH